MPGLPPLAAYVQKHFRHFALGALFFSAVVLSVSFVASIHGSNRLALHKRGVVPAHGGAQEMLPADDALNALSLQSMQSAIHSTAQHLPAAQAGAEDSLAEAEKFVDEYASGGFASIAISPAHPDSLATSGSSTEVANPGDNTADSFALAPPLPGAVPPAYTALSAPWITEESNKADLASSQSSKCFDVKNLKNFLPPGFGSAFKSAKKGSSPFDKFLTKSMLPTFGELLGAVKCVPSIAKSLKSAIRSPKSALSALNTVDKCVANLANIADKCQSSPSMLALAAVPKVGPMVSYVCGLVAKVVDKYMFIKEHADRMTSAPVFQCSLSKSAVEPHAQLLIASHAVDHPLEPVVSYHQLLHQLRAYEAYETIEEDGSNQPKPKLIIKALKKAGSKVGQSVKKAGNKAVGAIKNVDPIKILNTLLKKAQLPTIKELVGIVKCVVPVVRGLKKLVGKPSLAAANAVFKTLDGCMCKLDKLSQQCEGPAVMAISSQDPVGQVVGYVCSMAAKTVSKYTVIRDQIQEGLSVASIVDKAADGLSNRVSSASSSKSNSNSKPGAKRSQDGGGKGAKTKPQNKPSVSSKSKPKVQTKPQKRARLVIKSLKKAAQKVGGAVKVLGNPLDMGLKKAGLPTFKEMANVLKCTVIISKSFKSLAKVRDSSALMNAISSMDRCVRHLAVLSDKCDGPAVMAASMVPFGVGNAVSTACSTAAAVVEKYRSFKAALAAANFNSASCPVNGKSASSKQGGKSPAGKGKGAKNQGGKSPAGKGKGAKNQGGNSNANSNRRAKVYPSRQPSAPAVIFRQDRGAPVDGFSPPWNLYLLWTPSMQNMREYSETSVTSSEFIRRALRLGSRAETGSIDPHESHFLTGGFDSPKFTNDLANTCCSVIVAPPFENGFDVYSPADKTESRIQQRLRDFVANGNTIVVTGGIMSQLFLNRNFLTQLEPVSGNYDDGPFRLNIRFQKSTATRRSKFNFLGFDVLQQMDHNVYAVDSRSLPPQSRVVFNSMDNGVVVAVIPYCQGFPSQYDNSQSPVAISADRCDYLKAKSRRLGRSRPEQAPCSCGSLVYLGFDYSDFSDKPSDVRRWVRVLRAAASSTWGQDRGREDNEILNNQKNFQ